jgi:hypothetical protein
MLNNVLNVQVSDTTNDDNSNAAKYKKIILNSAIFTFNFKKNK